LRNFKRRGAEVVAGSYTTINILKSCWYSRH